MAERVDGVVPTPDAYKRISDATRAVEESQPGERQRSGARGQRVARRPYVAKITGAGSVAGQYTATEVYPDGTSKDGLVWDGGTATNSRPELVELSGAEGLEQQSGDVLVAVRKGFDSSANAVWYFSASGLTTCSNPSDGDLIKWNDTSKCWEPTTIEAELKTISGFNAANEQYLKNNADTLQWVDKTSC